MEIENITLVKLAASDGKVFTKDDVILGPILYLGINDSPDNYKEIDMPDIDWPEQPQ